MTAPRASVLIGWASIARWFGVHADTVKAWHRDRPLPISRDTKKQPPRALPEDLEQWVRDGRRRG